MCQKLWKLAGSRQSYCKNYLAYFFWPTLYIFDRKWNQLSRFFLTSHNQWDKKTRRQSYNTIKGLFWPTLYVHYVSEFFFLSPCALHLNTAAFQSKFHVAVKTRSQYRAMSCCPHTAHAPHRSRRLGSGQYQPISIHQLQLNDTELINIHFSFDQPPATYASMHI